MLDATYNWQTAIETISTEAEQWLNNLILAN